MFYSDHVNEKVYTDLMEQLKNVNADWLELRKSKQYRTGLVVTEIESDIKHLKFGALVSSIKRWTRGAKSRKIKSGQSIKKGTEVVPNYFSTDRIAIYTAVFGSYDNVPEPYCKPDNCDFYLFTDQKQNNAKSAWIVKEIPEGLEKMTNAEKNRYIKMHPDKLFDDYKYSIYIDGNVQVISDLTEYVHLIGATGIGIHQHDARNCVYQELEVIKQTGRETPENIERHKKYLQSTGMPENYGLLQCNVIVREHHNPVCISIMKDWWKEFCEYTKRDQISLPHVLYMHHILIDEIGVLGTNVYKNPSFRILNHR